MSDMNDGSYDEPDVIVVDGHEIPLPQARAMANCIDALARDGKRSAWHTNACGCCMAVHEDTEHPLQGFVIGKDGGISFVEISDITEEVTVFDYEAE